MFCQFDFLAKKHVQLQNCKKRNIIIREQINWYASTYTRCFVKLTFIWKKKKKPCKLNLIYRANYNSSLINWLQE